MIPLSVKIRAHPTSPCARASAMSPRFRLSPVLLVDVRNRNLQNAPRVTVCHTFFGKVYLTPVGESFSPDTRREWHSEKNRRAILTAIGSNRFVP